MNTLIAVFLIFVALVVLITIVRLIIPAPIYWYIGAFLAQYDFIFTSVPESYFKEVVRFGGHKKTLLSKQGYRIDEKGDIVKITSIDPPETSLPGGLRIIGWPFIDKIYKRQMKFLKSLPNGDIKIYDVENVDKFYARVDYPYALPFVKCEDRNNLPLLGHATLLAHVKNPTDSLFITANFYDTMIGLVLPSVRECLKRFIFDEIKVKDDLDEIIWKELNAKDSDLGEPDGVIGRLRKDYGIVIVALRIVNIDPPEEYRGMSLTKWKAEREADAAQAVGRKAAEETEGRVVQAVAIANGLTREELENILKSNPKLKGLPASAGGFKEDFAHNRDLLKRDRAGEGLEDIRVGNVDGTPLDSATSIVASMFGLLKSKGRRGGGNPGGGKSSEKKGDKKKKMTSKEAEDALKKDGII